MSCPSCFAPLEIQHRFVKLVTCDFCNQVSKIQQKYVSDITNEFKSLKIWESNRLSEEPIGIEGLKKLAKEIYKKSTANEILNPTN